MPMLKLSSPDPYWLDILPGARIQVVPVGAAALLLARNAARDARGDGGPDAGVDMQVAFTRTLALRGIIAWEGVGDADGAPVAVSPETIGQLLNDPSAFESIACMPSRCWSASRKKTSHRPCRLDLRQGR